MKPVPRATGRAGATAAAAAEVAGTAGEPTRARPSPRSLAGGFLLRAVDGRHCHGTWEPACFPGGTLRAILPESSPKWLWAFVGGFVPATWHSRAAASDAPSCQEIQDRRALRRPRTC